MELEFAFQESGYFPYKIFPFSLRDNLMSLMGASFYVPIFIVFWIIISSIFGLFSDIASINNLGNINLLNFKPDFFSFPTSDPPFSSSFHICFFLSPWLSFSVTSTHVRTCMAIYKIQWYFVPVVEVFFSNCLTSMFHRFPLIVS